MRKKAVAVLMAFSTFAWPAYPQSATKLRVIAAPGVTKSDAKDWKNTLAVSGKDFVLTCPKCLPVQTVTTPISEVASLRYGQNAYHHWVTGIVSGAFSLGIGLIVGLMPHHQHYFSIDLKDGKVIGIQADKGDYRQIAGMLQNTASLPIQVTPKDAHYLNGFNVQVVASENK
jgi:hypothetical protein